MIGRSEDVRHDVLLGHDARAMDHLMPGLVRSASEDDINLIPGRDSLDDNETLRIIMDQAARLFFVVN